MADTNINTPLKYHVNDQIYYLGISTGGNLGKQIAHLAEIAVMAKGMLYKHPDPAVQAELEEFIDVVDMIEKAHNPMLDSNPYLFNKARRVRKAIRIVKVLAYHIVVEYNLISGNMMRARLMDQFGKDRIKGQEGSVSGSLE